MKFKSISKLTLLAAFFFGGVSAAWAADEAKGAYKVTYDFETTTGLTVHGDGFFTDYGDGFGKVFRNGGGAQRTHYIQLPEGLFWHSNVSKEISFGFWVSARGMKYWDYTYAPLFAAYGAAPIDNKNTYPMVYLSSFGTFQVNDGGYCNFEGNLNTYPTSGKNTIYNTNHWFLSNEENKTNNKATEGTNWLNDNEWHYITVTMTETNVTIYMDAVLKNSWTIDGTDGKNVSGVFSYGGNLSYICLGGNQSWDLADNDMAFSFDDFMITNEALTISGIEAILDAKVLGIAQALYDDATYANGKTDLQTAINTLTTTSSAANRTALYTAIDVFKKANASLAHPYNVEVANADFGQELDGWTNTNVGTMAGTWGHNGWSRWLEKYEENGITAASSASRTLTSQPAGHYRLTAWAIARGGAGSALSLTDGTTPQSTAIAANGDTWTQITVDYDLAADGDLTIGYNYTPGETKPDWIALDDIELKYYGATDAYNTATAAVTANATTIATNKGDITSLINGDFETNADGWDGYTSHWANQDWTIRNWRGNSQNAFVERNSNGAITCTLNNMPAGSYKVVAAARAYSGGQITAQIAGTSGTTMTGAGDTPTAGNMEINANGVEMPYSSLGGFTSENAGHNWRWITATGTLAADGNLVINFNCTGTSWMAIDDVHLYCTQLGATSYTTTVTEGSAVSNSDGKVVTCDIKLNNPNSIVTSDAAITTAAGATMNNNLVGTNIAQLILYDGADNTFSMTEGDYTINNEYGAAKYYRQLTENTYCTVCLPFTPAIGTGTYYAPTSFENGTLTFAEVADADLKPNTPYILKPSGSYTDLWNNNNGGNSEKYNVKYTGVRPTTSISNEAMWFTGTYEKIANIGSWSGTYYVLGNDNKLHKVAGSVSVNPFRAYFYLSGANAPAFINLNFDGETTGVNMVHDSGLKVQNEYFDLQGRKVANPTKGLYIVNGKKVVIK